MKICPKCKLPKGRKSQIRSSTEKLLFSWLRLRPYRCHQCEYRFYRFSLQNGRTEPVKPIRSLTPGDKAEFEKLIGEIRAFETSQDESEENPTPLTRT